MGLPNRDEVEGKWDQAKGKTKETVGKAIDDKELAEAKALGRRVADVTKHIKACSPR